MEYFHRKWDPSRVVWNDVAFEGVGTIASIASLGSVADALQYGPKTYKSVKTLDIAMTVFGAKKAADEGDIAGVVLAIGGSMPWPVGPISNLSSLYLELLKGYYWTH